MLPGLDGFALCRQLRGQEIDTPVLVLSARDAVRRSGARARLRRRRLSRQAVRLRRAAGAAARARSARPQPPDVPDCCRYGPLTIDPVDHRVTVSGHVLSLTATEYRLLEYLVRRAESIVTRDQLAEYVWGGDYDPVLQRGRRLRRLCPAQAAGGHAAAADSYRARARLYAEARGGGVMIRWCARMPFRMQLTLWWALAFGLLLAVANLAIYAAFDAISSAISIERCAPSPPPSWPRPPTALGLHLHALPRDALADGEFADKFVQILRADGRVRLASPSLRDLPALVQRSRSGARRPRRHGPARVPRRRRTPRPRRRASSARWAASATRCWSASSAMRSTPICPGWLAARRRLGGGSRDDRPRSATGWRRGRWRRSSGSRGAPRGSRGATSPPGSTRRQPGRSRRDDAVAQRGARSPARRARGTSPLRLRRLARTARADHRDGGRDRRRADASAHRRGVSRHAGGRAASACRR